MYTIGINTNVQGEIDSTTYYTLFYKLPFYEGILVLFMPVLNLTLFF
jgi:hypothetical protein